MHGDAENEPDIWPSRPRAITRYKQRGSPKTTTADESIQPPAVRYAANAHRASRQQISKQRAAGTQRGECGINAGAGRAVRRAVRWQAGYAPQTHAFTPPSPCYIRAPARYPAASNAERGRHESATNRLRLRFAVPTDASPVLINVPSTVAAAALHADAPATPLTLHPTY